MVARIFAIEAPVHGRRRAGGEGIDAHVFADRVLPDLISAARASGDATANAAADVLERWSRNSDATDTGAILFEGWYNAYLAESTSPRSTSWGADYPAFRMACPTKPWRSGARRRDWRGNASSVTKLLGYGRTQARRL